MSETEKTGNGRRGARNPAWWTPERRAAMAAKTAASFTPEKRAEYRAKRIAQGNPHPPHTLDDLFTKIAAITPNERGCMIWIGPIDHGYPVHQLNKKTIFVHRYVLEQKLGRPIQPGLMACHHCDVPSCINDSHLYEGTKKDNYDDMVERGQISSEWLARIKGK